MYDAIFKVVIFGDKSTGKTTLRKRFMTNLYDSNCRKTIGVDFQTKDFRYKEVGIKLMIWDFAGEQRFRYMFPQYLYGTMGGILMYDITNVKTLHRVSEWCKIVKNYRDDIPILLVGNKLDLEERREVSNEQVEHFKEKNNISSSMEISVKTGENVEEMFIRITRMVMKRYSLFHQLLLHIPQSYQKTQIACYP